MSLLTLFQEKQRRRELDDRIGAFLRARYEFTKDPVHRVRRQDVYREAAKETDQQDNNEFRTRVANLAERFGARGILPHRVAMFCKMRPKGADLMPEPGPMGPAALARLQRAYYARLAAEGMGGEDGEPKPLKRFEEHRREISTAAIGRAVEHYWAMRKEVEVLGLYALEGLSLSDVAERTGTTKDFVHEVVRKIRVVMAGPTAKERQAYAMCRAGFSVRAVAKKLGLSKSTVANIVVRLGAVQTKPPGHETGEEEEPAVGGSG